MQVLMQAVRSAGQIIDLFLKLGPCWKKLVAGGEPYSAEFMSISTELQKGTRTLQILCSEAKSKKELGIVAKVGPLARADTCTAVLLRLPALSGRCCRATSESHTPAQSMPE